MTRPSQGPADDSGVTLVELLITIAIMGVAFVIIASGMFTHINAGVLHRNEATVAVELQKYAAALRGTTYSSCLTSYAVPGYAAPTGITATNSVLLWNPVAATYSTTPPASPCNTAGSQLVTVTVSFSDGDSSHAYSESLSVGRRS